MPFKTDLELEQIRQRVYDAAWPMVSDFDNRTWKLKDGRDADKTGLVYKSHDDKIGTIWKLHVNVNISADEYYERFVDRGEVVGWAPHVADYRHLERGVLAEWNWGVLYVKTAKIGLVSARDFITLYFHQLQEDGTHLIIATATEHADSPQNTGCVRGETLASATVLRPIPGFSNRCELHWCDNKDLKGYVPKAAVNFAKSSFLLDFAAASIDKTNSLKSAMAGSA